MSDIRGIPWQWEEDADLAHKWALEDYERRDTRAKAVADRSPEALIATAEEIEASVDAYEEEGDEDDGWTPEWGDLQLRAAAACRELAERMMQSD